MSKLTFPIGTAVRQVITPITGKVIAPEIVDNEVHYRVEFTNEHGAVVSRTFNDTQVEAVPPAA